MIVDPTREPRPGGRWCSESLPLKMFGEGSHTSSAGFNRECLHLAKLHVQSGISIMSWCHDPITLRSTGVWPWAIPRLTLWMEMHGFAYKLCIVPKFWQSLHQTWSVLAGLGVLELSHEYMSIQYMRITVHITIASIHNCTALYHIKSYCAKCKHSIGKHTTIYTCTVRLYHIYICTRYTTYIDIWYIHIESITIIYIYRYTIDTY